MKTSRAIQCCSAIALAIGLSGCGSSFTHVKPGQSARQILADRNAPQPLVPLSPDAMPIAAGTPRLAPGAAAGPLIPPPLPDFNVEPALPDPGNTANKVADLYTRGSFAMQAGQDADAILALEEAMSMDPNFTDALTKLVILYERTGNNAKAAETYRRLKKLGQPNGSSGIADLPGGLGLIR